MKKKSDVLPDIGTAESPIVESPEMLGVSPGQSGLASAIEELENSAPLETPDLGLNLDGTPKKKRGRPRKEEVQAVTVAQAQIANEQVSALLVALIAAPVNAHAKNIDPILPQIGYPEKSTFAFSEAETEIAKTACTQALNMLPPELLGKYGPLVAVIGGMATLIIPRVIMLSRVKAYRKELEKKTVPIPENK